MTTIPGISQNTATTANKTSTSNTLGQEQFLTLLVAQLQNQDPLNPADATEFTAQLAQYSQLEQLFNLNDAMDNLATAQTNSQKVSALSLMGKEVVVEDSKFTFDGSPVQVGYNSDGAASKIALQIKNSAGVVVATLQASETGKGEHFLTWDGKDESGNVLPSGTYQIGINAKSASAETTVEVSPLVRNMVTGVDLSGSEPTIITKTGEFTIASIHGVYDSSKTTTEDSQTSTTTATDAEATTASPTTAATPATTTAETADETLAKIISEATDGAGIVEGSTTGTTTK